MMNLFCEIGGIKRKSGSRTLTKRNSDAGENFQHVMDDKLHTSLMNIVLANDETWLHLPRYVNFQNMSMLSVLF